MADYLNIAGRVRTTASDGVAMEAQEVFDLEQEKSQQEVNAEVQAELADRYTKQETYNKEELDNMITTPDVDYETVSATDSTTSVEDVLTAPGEADTIYRVGNWDGTQYDASVYSEYSWNGSRYVLLNVKSGNPGDGVFDISVYNAGVGGPATYANLAAALSGLNVPVAYRSGGMSVKFLGTDGKYYQARYMLDYSDTTAGNTNFLNTANWQAVDAKPTAGSFNLVESGGVADEIALSGVYDVTAHNGEATFASLSALLNDANLSTLIPTDIRKGGMSIKFVQTSDNNYIQARCMAQNFSTDPNDWQGVDDVPTAGSENLVKSGGVYDKICQINNVFLDDALINKVEIKSNDESEIIAAFDSTGIHGKKLFFHTSDGEVDVASIKGDLETVASDVEDISNDIESINDKIESVDSVSIIEKEEKVKFMSDDESKTYAYIDREGVHGKNLDNVYGEYVFEKSEKIEVQSANSENIASIDKEGIIAKDVKVLEGTTLFGLQRALEPYRINFDGIYRSSPKSRYGEDFNLYYNISSLKFFTYQDNVEKEVSAVSNAIYVDKNGKEYVVRDILREIEPSSSFTNVEDYDMPNLETMVGDFEIRTSRNVPSQIYSLFDALVGTSSDVKIDVPQLLNISYPAYCNGLTSENNTYYVSDSDTHDTPAYKIYMYKISKYASSPQSKRKLFLFSGEHGNERLAIYDLYIIAHNLIHSTKDVYTYIRDNFDVYILPMLSVYSVYHSLRVNARGVNINRNYPFEGWVETQYTEVSQLPQTPSEGDMIMPITNLYFDSKTLYANCVYKCHYTDSSTYNWEFYYDYTGNSEGSEFETQVIIGLMNELKPHLTIDHHNYGVNPFQFYAEIENDSISDLAGKVCVNVSSSFVRNYPQYFGTTPKLFVDASSTYSYNTYGGRFQHWAERNGYLGLIIETGENVNYNNGVVINYYQELYTHVPFELAEYTLRSFLGNLIEIFTKRLFKTLKY